MAREGTSCPINRAALLARFHAMEDGRLLSGAAAFAAMWRAISRLCSATARMAGPRHERMAGRPGRKAGVARL